MFKFNYYYISWLKFKLNNRASSYYNADLFWIYEKSLTFNSSQQSVGSPPILHGGRDGSEEETKTRVLFTDKK